MEAEIDKLRRNMAPQEEAKKTCITTIGYNEKMG